MPTKDPHIALIDAQEQLHTIRTAIKAAIAGVQKKVQRGETLTEYDKRSIARFRQLAIDATRRVQDELAEELGSHGKLS